MLGCIFTQDPSQDAPLRRAPGFLKMLSRQQFFMCTSSKSRSSNAVLQMYFYLSWGDTWYNIDGWWEFHCFLIKKPGRGFKGPSCPDTCLQREGHESLHQWGWSNTQKPTTKSVFIVFKNFTRPPGLLTLSSGGTRKSKLHQDQNNFHNLYESSAHLFNVHILIILINPCFSQSESKKQRDSGGSS